MTEKERKAEFVTTIITNLAKREGYGGARFLHIPRQGEYIAILDYKRTPMFLIDVTASSLTKENCVGGMSDYTRAMRNPHYRITGTQMEALLEQEKTGITYPRAVELLKRLIQYHKEELPDAEDLRTFLVDTIGFDEEEVDALGYGYVLNIIDEGGENNE